MAKCKRCEGWGSVRDPKAPDGWARDKQGNAVPCLKADGGCDQSGEVAEQPSLAA